MNKYFGRVISILAAGVIGTTAIMRPGTTIQAAEADYEVNARLASGDYGDVFFIPSTLGSDEYAKYLEPLGSLQELSLKYNFLEQSKVNGDVVYGIPSFAYLSGIVYNKEVFDKAGISQLPKSIDEFIEDMRLIKEHTEAIPLYTNYTSEWALPYWESFPYIEMTGNAGYRYNTLDTTLIALCNKCIYSTSEESMQVKLLKYMEPPSKPVTLQKLVEMHPLLCIIAVSLVFLVIVVFILIEMRQKDKNNRQHAIDAKRYQMLAALSDEYMFEYDYEKEVISFDPKFAQAFGFGGVIRYRDYDHTDEVLSGFMDRLAKVRDKQVRADEPFCLKKEHDGDTWYRMVVSVVEDGKGKPLHMIGKITNVQKEMKEVQSYQEKAERDALTKLYNRNGFNAYLPETASEVVFAVLDMDNFKSVNDTLGHAGGDYALTLLARAMEKHMGKDALMGRYGGDEFMLMMAGITAEDAQQKLQGLVDDMNRDICYEGREHTISISVGAVYSKEQVRVSELFAKADGALYAAKSQGKNVCHIERLKN